MEIKEDKKKENGRFYYYLFCLLGTALFLEAYLNHIGLELFPDSFENYEKKCPKEKFKAVLDKLGCPVDTNGDHHQAFFDAFNFRNKMAHGKKEITKRDKLTEWERLCTEKNVKRILMNSEELVRIIHEASGHKLDPFSIDAHAIYREI
jgi:hypothetical protein